MNATLPLWNRPLLVALVALLSASFSSSTEATLDPHGQRAEALAERTMAAMGGHDAWSETRFLSFNFGGFRTHHWDKHQNRHRLEGSKRNGDTYLVLLDLDTRKGSAWLNGEPAEGEAAADLLEMAYGAWINDTYWLVMPYKLKDPGVSLHYEGEESVGETTYEKVRMTFDGVGLTPGDTYWVYLNPENGLVEHWSYVLESYEEGRPPTFWSWAGWQRFGKVLLPTEHHQAGSDRQLPMQAVAVYEHLPDSVFDSPAAVTTAAETP